MAGGGPGRVVAGGGRGRAHGCREGRAGGGPRGRGEERGEEGAARGGGRRSVEVHGGGVEVDGGGAQRGRRSTGARTRKRPVRVLCIEGRRWVVGGTTYGSSARLPLANRGCCSPALTCVLGPQVSAGAQPHLFASGSERSAGEHSA